MKLLIFFALVALASCEIDWSTIKPITQTPEYRAAFPNFVPHAKESTFNPQRGGRVIRGNVVGPTDMPYQVGVIVHLFTGNGWCGGSLVRTLRISKEQTL